MAALLVHGCEGVAFWRPKSLGAGEANVSAAVALRTANRRLCTAAERRDFLTVTNTYRCMHGAAPVVWDEAMAVSAAEYVYPLTSMAHSDSYSLRPAQAENLMWRLQGVTPESAVTSWYSEVEYCKGTPTDFIANDGCSAPSDEGRMTGHFTALVWTTATRMGCAFSADGKIGICRYAASGETQTVDTPNMNDDRNYAAHVLPRSKEQPGCGHGGQSNATEAQRRGQEQPAAPERAPPWPSCWCHQRVMTSSARMGRCWPWWVRTEVRRGRAAPSNAAQSSRSDPPSAYSAAPSTQPATAPSAGS